MYPFTDGMYPLTVGHVPAYGRAGTRLRTDWAFSVSLILSAVSAGTRLRTGMYPFTDGMYPFTDGMYPFTDGHVPVYGRAGARLRTPLRANTPSSKPSVWSLGFETARP